MKTAECLLCGKRLRVLDRARPTLYRHKCINSGPYSDYLHGQFKPGSEQVQEVAR